MAEFNYTEYIKNNPLLQEEVKEKLLTESQEVKEAAPGYKHDCAAHVMHESYGYGLCLEGRHTLVETTEGNAEVTHYDVMFKNGEIIEKIPVSELKIVTSESHTHSKYEEDDVDPQNEEETPSSKTTVSELKAQIKEMIRASLEEEQVAEQEEEEVEVDVEDEIEAEPAMDAAPEGGSEGLTADEKEIQDSLKLAYDNAIAIGDQKLADQIGNSITFFTRTHVVER